MLRSPDRARELHDGELIKTLEAAEKKMGKPAFAARGRSEAHVSPGEPAQGGGVIRVTREASDLV